MNGREIKKIVNEISDNMEITHPVFVRVVSFRNKIASISLVSRTLRINKKFVSLCNNRLLKYIIIHELVHVKLGHHYHNDEFYKEIQKYLDNEVEQYDKRIVCLLNKVTT